MKERTKKIRVLLADDHQVVRMGLSAIISTEPDMIVVAEAEDGAEAVRLATETTPDVVVMDLMMPKLDGARATAELRAHNPDAKVLILTTFGESQDVKRALDAGAKGALVKDTSQTDLLAAIRSTAAGQSVVCDEIAASLADRGDTDLTERQLEILNGIAKGFNNREIAHLLGVSRDCVKNHLRTIFARLGASSRSEAVVLALKKRLLKI